MMIELVCAAIAGFIGWAIPAGISALAKKPAPVCGAFHKEGVHDALLYCDASPDERCRGRLCAMHCKRDCGGACIDIWKKAVSE